MTTKTVHVCDKACNGYLNTLVYLSDLKSWAIETRAGYGMEVYYCPWCGEKLAVEKEETA